LLSLVEITAMTSRISKILLSFDSSSTYLDLKSYRRTRHNSEVLLSTRKRLLGLTKTAFLQESAICKRRMDLELAAIPLFQVSIEANVSVNSSARSASFRMSSPRSVGLILDHGPRKAARAAFTASSMSCSPPA
jgi:hypothetical protein